VAWSEMYGVDPNLTAIIMQIESCGDPRAASHAGAQGLFQVMPFHFAAGEDSLDPDTNARRGLNYFVERLNQTNGDIGRAFAGYNGGHVAAAASWDQWAAETQRYYRWSTGIYSDIQSGVTESPTVQNWLQAGGASLCRQAAQRLGLNS
jgi:soluble lytic murein transglycosylase-like protein